MFILLYDPSLCDTSTEDNSVNVDYLKMLPVPSLSSSLSSDFFTSTEMVNSEKTAPHDPEDPVVIAVEEGKAILTCPVTPPKNDSIDLILWFRGDAETASYSLDARSGPLGRARHFPSNHLSSRAYIDITGRKGRTQYRAIRLDVIVAPRDLIIMDEYGQRLRDTVGPYNEGAHLTLVCEAEGGNPAPSLIWKKDGGTVDDTWSTTALGIVRNEVVIPRLKRTDLMTSLTCHANNSELTSGKLASVTLDLNLRPLDVKITSPRRPMSAGKKVDLSCQSSGSRPSAVVTWWQGSKLLQHVTEEVSTNENLTISTLHFVPSVEDNGKLLSCRSDHSILPDSALEDSWTLDVFYVPKISLSLGASAHHDQVREGANVSLECHVTANPRVTSVTWQFNSRPLISSPRLGVIIRNQSLFLRKIPRSFSGKFKCLAANVEGEGHSQEISLKVLCK
ncbi:Nephrin [Halotydeus destructor]|nr:Nephrin [Halotydeus destructor]